MRPCHFALAAGLLPSSILAQCPSDWFPASQTAGVRGIPYAAITWDPDGPGPLPGRLILTGDFTSAGPIATKGLVAWDGSACQPLGPGLGFISAYGPGIGWALAVYDNDLIVGGTFESAGGIPANCIARYDGAAWHNLGVGISPFGTSTTVNPAIRALTVYNGDLIAAGSFDVAGGQSAMNIAKWNGTSWSPLGAGVNGRVRAVLPFAGDLYAAGDFTSAGGQPAAHIARWNGASWSPLFNGLSGGPAYPGTTVTTLRVFNGELIVGGSFSMAGSQLATNIARWTGTQWLPLWTGTDGYVTAARPYAGALAVAGDFYTAGGVQARYVASWSASLWGALGTNANSYGGGVDTLALFNGELFAGGQFIDLASTPAGGIARYDGSAWTALNPGLIGPRIQALTTWQGQVIAGGNLGVVGVSGATGRNIARWTGVWEPFGASDIFPISSFTVCNGRLFAGGFCTVLMWGGQAWLPVLPAPEIDVVALATFNDQLIAGGSAGMRLAHQILRFDGSAWQPMDDGLSPINGIFGVNTLAFHNGELYAGGYFLLDDVANSPSTCIARWDGAHWRPLAHGFSVSHGLPCVVSIASHQGALIAGGFFDHTGSTPVPGIASWCGTSWTPLGSGAGSVNAILSRANGDLIAAGSLPSGGPVQHRIARWDGAAWRPLSGIAPTDGSGQSGTLLENGNAFLAGGDFLSAGGVPSPLFARYACTCPVNCDSSTVAPVLNIADFTCFLNAFAAGTPWANCDASTSPPVLNILDFICFLNRFSVGCT